VLASLLLVPSTLVFSQNLPQDCIPQVITMLGRGAVSQSGFSFDHSMLVMASKRQGDDDNLRRIIAGVDGISVHRFRLGGPGGYSPDLVNAVRQQCQGGGWQHFSGGRDKNGFPAGTDFWVRLESNTVRDIAVLFAREDQVNFLSVSGSISPIELLHLSGHFGIPRIEGGVVIASPATPPPPGGDQDWRH
jgi:hypothetical protein